MPHSLPIDPLVPEIVSSLKTSPNAVLVAPPGAGKTTRIPPAISESGLLSAEKFATVLLQPRRVAARAAARRIAQERRWSLGDQVGYHIRFDNRTGPKTRLRVLTEGILTRQIQADPFLTGIGCVLLDEFHERSIHSDLALALLREIQTTVRPGLRIVVMSATMEASPVSQFLGDAPIFEAEGRLFPIDYEYLARPSREPVWEQTARAVRRVLSQGESTGHVLVFLPGIGEIRRTQGLLSGIGAEIHILHSSISNEEQDHALRPSQNRKVILATNIAETSLTIEGVRTVVDSGLVRVLFNDPRLGIDRLETRRISQASAHQRAGRAGRTAPGRCLRLWTREEDAGLQPSETPEIHRVDLTATILSLHAYGTRDPREFSWFDPPREEDLQNAERLLRMLGALDDQGKITPAGEKLAGLPLHPRLGRILIAGAEIGLLREAAGIAAILSEGGLTAGKSRRKPSGWEGQSDVLDQLRILEGEGDSTGDYRGIGHARRIRDELVRLGNRLSSKKPTESSDDTGLLRLPLHGYPDRVTRRRENDPARGVMVGERGILLEPSSVVRQGEFFLSLDPRDPPSGGGEARVAIASSIDKAWLTEIHPHLVEKRLHHRYDSEKEKVISRRQNLFSGLLIQENPTSPSKDPEAASRALYDFFAPRLDDLLHSDEKIEKWLLRVTFLSRAMPDLNLRVFDDEELKSVLEEASAGVFMKEKLLRRFNSALENRLDWKQRSALDQHAPEAVEVPSGSRIRLQYQDGGPPILPVRIQEIFGLRETPRIAGGRVPVVLHLLGPNYRPVQITSDLASFWDTIYHEVRKELRARYPKHPWPENPREAQPRAVGSRKRSSS